METNFRPNTHLMAALRENLAGLEDAICNALWDDPEISEEIYSQMVRPSPEILYAETYEATPDEIDIALSLDGNHYRIRLQLLSCTQEPE